MTRAWRVAPEATRVLHPLTLAFEDGALEASFLEELTTESRAQAHVVGAVGVVIFALFGFLDRTVVPDHWRVVVVVRGATLVLALLCLAATFVAGRNGRLAFPLCVGVGAIGLFSDWVNVLAERQDFAFPGIMVVLLFLFTAMRLRFVWAVPTAVIVVAAYELSAVMRGDQSGFDYVFSNFYVLSVAGAGALVCYSLERLARRDFLQRRELATERELSDLLLRNVLPDAIVERLRTSAGTVAESFDDVSVLFADVVGFTPLATAIPPESLVAFLDDVFTRFDDLTDRHQLEKIKTIGDAYMVVAGLPAPRADHAVAIAEMALEMLALVRNGGTNWPEGISIRVGICSGPVVAGVIGTRKFAYDLWGDTVNTASRMESHGLPGVIQVAAATHALLHTVFEFDGPHVVDVKGKGPMETWYLGARLDEGCAASVPDVRVEPVG